MRTHRKGSVGLFKLLLLSCCIFLPMAARGQSSRNYGCEASSEPWRHQQAWDWYRKAGPIRGCNYVPRSAVNDTEMWQAETFDPKTIDQELGWAERAGYSSLRVFLQYVVWQHDPDGFKHRLDEFLAVADKHGMSAAVIFFDDCAFAVREPYVGKQDDPVPGVHNSGWVPSPGLKRVTDRSTWPDLERYVRDIVSTFGKDKRVVMWDLYNEPGNSNMGAKSLPLVEATFAWARAAHPGQPLTMGVWQDFEGPMSRRMMELSNVVSFHAYDIPDEVKKKIVICRAYARPVICTEFLRRQVGNTFASILPLFAASDIGWYNWGLVAGKTQTYMPWGSRPGDAMPRIWQHDTLRPDGTPYDAAELDAIKAWRPHR